MPNQEFDQKTSFALHDINADGYFESKSLIHRKLKCLKPKKYDPQHNEEDDPNEMMENFHRMMEHINKEADTNRDGLISWKELYWFYSL